MSLPRLHFLRAPNTLDCMFIVWGTKIIRRRLGLVALVCPICRDITSCRVSSVLRVSHVYYIPTGKGKLALYESSCSACGLILPHHPTSTFTPVPEPLPTMEALAEATNPDVFKHVDDLIALGELVRTNTLPAERRVRVIAETLDSMSYMTELGAKQGRDESLQALAALGLIITLPATLILLFDGQKLYGAIAGVLAAAFLALTIRLIMRGPRSMLRRKTIPTFRIAMEPMNPTREELDAAVELLRSGKSPMGKWVTGKLLDEGLRSAALSPSPR